MLLHINKLSENSLQNIFDCSQKYSRIFSVHLKSYKSSLKNYFVTIWKIRTLLRFYFVKILWNWTLLWNNIFEEYAIFSMGKLEDKEIYQKTLHTSMMYNVLCRHEFQPLAKLMVCGVLRYTAHFNGVYTYIQQKLLPLKNLAIRRFLLWKLVYDYIHKHNYIQINTAVFKT